MNRSRTVPALLLVALSALPALAADHSMASTATPAELVDTYNAVADGILALKRSEASVVRAVLATTYNHAAAVAHKAMGKLAAGEDARGEVEALADLVAQLGNEGDASVAAIRKRLLEGGHHHHADDGEDGEYEEGFVIVTRKARKAFLDASGNIARLAGAPDAGKLEAAWKAVAAQYEALED